MTSFFDVVCKVFFGLTYPLISATSWISCLAWGHSWTQKGMIDDTFPYPLVGYQCSWCGKIKHEVKKS